LILIGIGEVSFAVAKQDRDPARADKSYDYIEYAVVVEVPQCEIFGVGLEREDRAASEGALAIVQEDRERPLGAAAEVAHDEITMSVVVQVSCDKGAREVAHDKALDFFRKAPAISPQHPLAEEDHDAPSALLLRAVEGIELRLLAIASQVRDGQIGQAIFVEVSYG
jgi:hypothetical protein